MIRRTLIALAAAGALTTAQACGPDFSPDVFVRTNRPDLPTRYVQGHLGILQTDFSSPDLFVAYRYLNGGTLSANEQRAMLPTNSEPFVGPQDNPAIRGWNAERAKYPDVPKEAVDPNLSVKISMTGGYTYNSTYPNCADDAFRTAAFTLQSRAATWGKSDPSTMDWLHAQDAVFAACSNSSASAPQPAPASAPALLRQDRAYQLASAGFYSRNYDAAVQQFRSIAADSASPWSNTAGYAAARALIRKAFFAKAGAEAPADYDPATMQEAEKQIRNFLASHPPQPWQRAAEAQLALVRIRLEPEARTRELATQLAGPADDSNFAQDIQDMLWILRTRIPDGFRAEIPTWDNGTSPTPLDPAVGLSRANATRNKAFADTAALRSSAPMLDWSITLRSLAPDAVPHALQQWQQSKSLPWLVAALTLAPDNIRPNPALLQAAAEVPTTSSAWQMVTYHLARLQIAAGNTNAARTTIATLQSALDQLPGDQQEPSTRNALRGLSMRAAASREDVITHLARTILESESEASYASRDCTAVMGNKGDWHRCLTPGKEDLDTDAARFLNEQAPLTVWVEAANSPSIPQPLRQSIAMQGWTRATLLGDKATAATLQPLLPEPMQKELAQTSPLTPWVVLARNPGLQPRLDAGVQRAYTYDFVENYRLNWCYNPQSYTTPAPSIPSLTASELQQGSAQAQKVHPIRSVNVGRNILNEIKANPRDPQAAESLYLVLRMIRYGCNPVHEPGQQIYGGLSDPRPSDTTGDQLLQLRRDTAALMRRYFAASPWTRKAAPFVGDVPQPKGKQNAT
jgi:hypothetical protein